MAPALAVGAYDIVYFTNYFMKLNANWEGHIAGSDAVQTGAELLKYLLNTGNFIKISGNGGQPRRFEN